MGLSQKRISQRTLSTLKSGKSDGIEGLISNHLLISFKEVKVQLGKLIIAIKTHGHQFKDVLTGTIVIILKDSR